jgi:hypothetical protein
MHPTIKWYNILPGDRIVEPKSNLRIVQHHSIYLGQDIYGVEWIIENKIGHGVRLVTSHDYFNDVIEIKRIERFLGSGNERRLAVQKALWEVGKPYDLINYNCQHFANYVQHGEIRSEQVTGGIALGLALLIIAGIFSAK